MFAIRRFPPPEEAEDAAEDNREITIDRAEAEKIQRNESQAALENKQEEDCQPSGSALP